MQKSQQKKLKQSQLNLFLILIMKFYLFITGIFFFYFGNVSPVHAKVYSRCEFLRQLRDIYKFPKDQLSTWVCIAFHESRFNTSAHNTATGDHGIFQISQNYWCSPPGKVKGCGLPCAYFRDDNIQDDINCVSKIYDENKGRSGNGFNAWVVYSRICKDNEKASSFLRNC